MISKSYTMVCPSVCGDNPRALMGLTIHGRSFVMGFQLKFSDTIFLSAFISDDTSYTSSTFSFIGIREGACRIFAISYSSSSEFLV